MADDPIVTMLKAVETKLKTASFLTDVNNVIIGESDPFDLEKFEDDKYPRMEILVDKLKGSDYVSQNTQDEEFRISIAGYIRRADRAVTSQDMYDIINEGTEAKSLMYSFNDDSVGGTDPTDGYLFVGGFYELFFEYEFMTRIASWILEVEFKINLSTVGRD